ncbi:MAG: alpha/beta hydrolase [Actinomycetales bacterium]|nr:alpha/beta hydrolase [Actinomycetales bacterium]
MNRVNAVIGHGLNGVFAVAPSAGGRLAFELFRHPLRRGVVRPHEREAHAAAVRETAEVDGLSVTLYRWGDGERPVLYMHGWGSRGSRCAGLVPGLLRDGCTVLSYDAPGHGESRSRGNTVPRNRAIAALLQERYGPFHGIVGYSFGALGAFHAVKTGVVASRLVVVSGPCEFGFLVEEYCRWMGLRPGLVPELRRRVETSLLPETGIWDLFSATDHPEAVTVPILVLHDEDDEVVPVAHARRVVETYGDRAVLRTTRGRGHRRMLVHGPVIEEIRSFLRQDTTPLRQDTTTGPGTGAHPGRPSPPSCSGTGSGD